MDRLTREDASTKLSGPARGKHLARVVLDPECQRPGRGIPCRVKDWARSPPETAPA